MTDEVTAAAGATAPTVETLQATVADLQKQLALSEQALKAEKENSEHLAEAMSEFDALKEDVTALKSALNARADSADQHAASARALIAGYERGMETNSPRTIAELKELKALLLGA